MTIDEMRNTIDEGTNYTLTGLATIVSRENKSIEATETELLQLIGQGVLVPHAFSEADLAAVEVTGDSIANYLVARGPDVTHHHLLSSTLTGQPNHTIDDLAGYITFADGRSSLGELKAAIRRGQLTPADSSTLVDLSALRPGGNPFLASRSSIRIGGGAFLAFIETRDGGDKWTTRA